MASEQSLLEVLAVLRDAGYVTDFSAAIGGLRCGACGEVHPSEQADIDRIARFEGASDPDDETILVALSCTHCGARGTLVAAYGPTASPEEVDVLVGLTDARYD